MTTFHVILLIMATLVVASNTQGTGTLDNIEMKVNEILQNQADDINKEFLKEELKKTSLDINNKLQNLQDTLINKLDNITHNQGCPEGFFKVNGASSCYKFFNDKSRTWPEGDKKCRDEGLLLAMPENNAIEVRKYIIDTYGGNKGHVGDTTFVGAKGDGSNVRWQRNNAIIPSTNLYWRPGNTGGLAYKTKGCLVLLTDSGDWNKDPSAPFFMGQCTGWKEWILCEQA